MKKLLFIIIIGIALFAQERPKQTPQQQAVIKEINALKGEIAVLEEQKAAIYKQILDKQMLIGKYVQFYESLADSVK